MSLEIIKILVNTIGVAAVVAAIRIAQLYIERYSLERYITKAVKAAEVLFDVPKSGEEKKKYVFNAAKEFFKGTWVTDKMIEVFLEAAVSELHSKEK